MAKLDKSGLEQSNTDNIKSGGIPSITKAEDVRTFNQDAIDSAPNLVDGGNVFDAEVGYSSNLTLSDQFSFIHKQFLDDSIKIQTDSISTSTSYTPDTDVYDAVNITALATNITINNPPTQPEDFKGLIFRIKDNGSSKSITWGNQYMAFATSLPTATTLGKENLIVFMFNKLLNVYQCMSVTIEP